jgi:hypothetical protein
MTATPPSSFAELLTAWSTLGIGVVGSGVTLWQFRKSGFRPKFSARIDAPREACELRIVNRGRATGIIGQLLVRQANGEIVTDVEFEGFANGVFTSLALPGLGSMRILIQAPPGIALPKDIAMVVDFGAKKPQVVTPRNAQRDRAVWTTECPTTGHAEARG